MSILLLLLSIIGLVLLIIKVKLHPFFALLLVSISFALLSGMKGDLIISSIQNGFGSTLGKIGLVIIMGVVIGAFLENTGAAMSLAEGVLNFVGKQNVIIAMGVVGYIISIPVFGDSGFLLMNSLNRNLTKKAGISLAATAIALALGLILTHNLVPPTPGPIAAAATLNADLALVIPFGLITAAVGLVAGLVFAKFYASKTYIDPDNNALVPVDNMILTNSNLAYRPGFFLSSLPILVPIILIVGKSVLKATNFLQEGSFLASTLNFMGESVIALLIGVFLCLLLPEKLHKDMISSDGWIGKCFKDAASILLITGAGGIFGTVLKDSGVADQLGAHLSTYNIGIFLPFILGAALKSSQGSSTVALITVASIILPLMPILNLVSETDKALAVTAIGSGALVVCHANDSFFWVVTQMSGMNVKQGYQLLSFGTLIVGCTSMVATYILFVILH
ncbi:MAG: GntP family permease [Saprospiraceae bacterium]|nr:GntP family permease [Saprospiraceae bacterium]